MYEKASLLYIPAQSEPLNFLVFDAPSINEMGLLAL